MVNELFALDAAGAYTDDVKVTYISNGAAPKLRVTVDSAFLTDESREYPIVIDPSVMVTGANNIADSFVRQGSPSTNYNMMKSCLPATARQTACKGRTSSLPCQAISPRRA